MQAIAERAQGTWDKFRKERDFHRMHHNRVVQVSASPLCRTLRPKATFAPLYNNLCQRTAHRKAERIKTTHSDVYLLLRAMGRSLYSQYANTTTCRHRITAATLPWQMIKFSSLQPRQDSWSRPVHNILVIALRQPLHVDQDQRVLESPSTSCTCLFRSCLHRTTMDASPACCVPSLLCRKREGWQQT